MHSQKIVLIYLYILVNNEIQNETKWFIITNLYWNIFQYLHKSNQPFLFLPFCFDFSQCTYADTATFCGDSYALAMQIRANNAQFIKWTAEHKCINLCMLLSPPSRPLNSPTIGHLQCQLQTALSYEKLFSTQNSFCFGNISQLVSTKQ